MNQTTPSTAVWVEKALASLLSAPHISFPPSSIPTGPGPIDLFSTRFNNTFTTDATGLVDGAHVNRDGLKEKLLDLQRHYNPDTVTFHADGTSNSYQNHSNDTVQVSFAWTTKDSTRFEVSSAAVVVTSDGVDKISFLSLRGNPELFQNPEAPISANQ